ncbi:transcription factor SPT20 homolog [Galendromus occidentalis]|uniref:Transcription factor SPT20 homolog n=1 Tax=Galendromus occidentalis TaxID=34638 RepID=A0AAJ7SJ16_9ACAR|nr:transcription factor SPT20 homolog [Galendromus occidentalis]
MSSKELSLRMDSCHDVVSNELHQRDFLLNRLKRRVDGYRAHHAQVLPRHQEYTENLNSLGRDHTQQLQQRFLESKSKKSKKDKGSVAASQPRTVHHAHAVTHQQHQQSLQYSQESNVRLVGAVSPISQHPQPQQMRQVPQEDRLTSPLNSSNGTASNSVADSRDEKSSFDGPMKSNNVPFAHIKQESSCRSDDCREYNHGHNQQFKQELRNATNCAPHSADSLSGSFNFTDGSLNPDMLRDLIADVAKNANDLMAEFTFDEVKSSPNRQDAMTSSEQMKLHHQQQKQQMPPQQHPQGSLPPLTKRGRCTESPNQSHQQKPNVIPSPSPTVSSSSVPSVPTPPPYTMIRSPLSTMANQTSNPNAAMMSSENPRPSPNTLVGVTAIPVATSSQQTPSSQAQHAVSQSKLVNPNAALRTSPNQSRFENKNIAPTIGYSQSQAQPGQQSTYMNAQAPPANMPHNARSMAINAHFQEMNHNNRIQQQQQQQQQQQLQMNRRDLTMTAQRTPVFAQQAGIMCAQQQQQHLELTKSQPAAAYQRRLPRTAPGPHPIMQQQQQQQHLLRHPQQCNQFRPMGSDPNHAYQSAAEPNSREPPPGLSQRVQQRPMYAQQPVANQWRSYPEHCSPTPGHPMMNMQQIRNGGAGVTNNPMMINRPAAENHDQGAHGGQFLSGPMEQRNLGNSGSSIDFNNLEFLTGVETTNELMNFDTASSALNMLDDVLGHQNVSSTYKN